MRPRIREKPPVPGDEAILALDNVPVELAATYLGWQPATVRLALREGRAPFGVAIPGEGGDNLIYKISPGGLVQYKRSGVPCVAYETLLGMIRQAVQDAMVHQPQN